MEETYTIEKNKIKEVAIYDLKRSGLIAIITIVFTFASMYYLVAKSKGGPSIDEFLPIILSAGLFTIFICFLIGWYLYSFKLLFYSNYIITINDGQVQKYIDIDIKAELTGFKKLNWQRVKQISSQHDIYLQWINIQNVIENNSGLTLRSANSNNFSGSGQIFIPKEIENYQYLKRLISERTKRTTANT